MGLIAAAFAGLVFYFFNVGGDAVPAPSPTVLSSPTAPLQSNATTTSPANVLQTTPTSPDQQLTSQFSDQDKIALASLMAKFNTGDYLGALAVADTASVNPRLTMTFQSWLRAQMPPLLISAGWIKIKLGDCDEGVRLLSRAEGFQRAPEISKGLAYCHQKLGNIAAADEHFQTYLEQTPRDAEMLMLYADTLESQARFTEAVQTLETAAAKSDEDQRKMIEQRLAAMRLRSNESRAQTTDTSRNFTLTYRIGDHDDAAGIVLETLEQAIDEYVEDYGYKEPPARLEVILYPFEQFRGIVAGGPEWAEGAFDGRLRIPIKTAEIRHREYRFLKTVLRHELVHALNALLTGGRTLPPWFEEGMAQRLSCARTGCGAFRYPPTPGTFLPEASFASPYITLDSVAAGQAYRQSLFLIYSLEAAKSGDDTLRNLIKNLGTTGALDPDTILEPSGFTFSSLHKQAVAWWGQRSFK